MAASRSSTQPRVRPSATSDRAVAKVRPSGLTTVASTRLDGPSCKRSSRPWSDSKTIRPVKSHHRAPSVVPIKSRRPSSPKVTVCTEWLTRRGKPRAFWWGTSQSRMVPSSPPIARTRPSGSNARAVTAPASLQVCPIGPSKDVSQRWMTPPSVPEAKTRPSGETAKLVNSVPWGGKSKPRSVSASQTWSLPALLPVMTFRPSGVKAIASTGVSRCNSGPRGLLVATSQRRTRRSWPPVTSVRPSELRAHVVFLTRRCSGDPSTPRGRRVVVSRHRTMPSQSHVIRL